MPLNSLSPELLDLIIYHLGCIAPSHIPRQPDGPPPSQGLSRYATIFKKWQAVIERHTFSAVKTNSSSFSKLKQIIGTCPRRRNALKELFYQIDLPLYSERRIHCYERHREHQANLVAFQHGLRELWEELSLWGNSSSRLHLVLTGDTPVRGAWIDRWAYPEQSLALDDPNISTAGENSILPHLTSVLSLQLRSPGQRIHHRAIGTLLLNLPNIRHLDIQGYGIQYKDKEFANIYGRENAVEP